MTPIEEKVSLSQFTSWLVGGEADYFAQPTSKEELIEVVQWAYDKKVSLTILGGGTNVLVSDTGVEGLVLCTRRLKGVEETRHDGRYVLTCLAGTTKSTLLKNFLKQKLAPSLFLAGLPGDVGGGIAMNAGVSEQMVPREFVEIVDWVEVYDPADQKVKTYKNSDLTWAYRTCKGYQPGVILRAQVSWLDQPSAEVLKEVKAANKLRLTKQPLDQPSCGSVFRNPEGHTAGQLIDSCGIKGYKIGGAQISEKHANFIVNTGEATAQNIHEVIEFARNTVRDQKGIELRSEVVYMGRW